MKNNNECVLGTQLKLNIHIDPLGSLHMDDYDFECKFFVYQNKTVTIQKQQMAKIDNDNYLALLDTMPLGIGNLHITLTAYIPDNDFNGQIRKEIVCVPTDINIINCV